MEGQGVVTLAVTLSFPVIPKFCGGVIVSTVEPAFKGVNLAFAPPFPARITGEVTAPTLVSLEFTVTDRLVLPGSGARASEQFRAEVLGSNWHNEILVRLSLTGPPLRLAPKKKPPKLNLRPEGVITTVPVSEKPPPVAV